MFSEEKELITNISIYIRVGGATYARLKTVKIMQFGINDKVMGTMMSNRKYKK